MTVIINGTTGITSVDGSAAAPSVTGTDTNTGIVYGTDTLSLVTGGVAAATISSAQVVNFANTPTVGGSPIGASAATPTALGTVYGKMTTVGGTPYLTALGYNAGTNTTGVGGTAVGVNALNANTTGPGMTAVGYSALAANTIGTYHTAVGYQALSSLSNTSSSGATALGYQAGLNYNNADTTSSSTFLGFWAGKTTTTGTDNTFVGSQAGQLNNTGGYNCALGSAALQVNTTGSYNTAFGVQALRNNTTASNNTAVGYQALYSENRTADTNADNTAIGYQAGYSLTTGQRNTFLGMYSGNGGFGAGSITTGTYNISIGFATGASATGRNNSIVIGTPYAVVDKGENTGFISPNGGGVYQGNNSASWSTTSDRRLKKNIIDNNVGLEKLMQVQVRNFEYRLPEEIEELEAHCAIKKEGVQLGVIAQELQQVLPDCVKEESTGVLSVDPDNLTWYTINAIQEQQALIIQLTERITALEAK